MQKPAKLTKGPCRTCRFSELLLDGNLECTWGPPTVVAIELVKGKITGNLGVQWIHARMGASHPGCFQYEKTNEKKTLPNMPDEVKPPE